jgi:hypothetical protein
VAESYRDVCVCVCVCVCVRARVCVFVCVWYVWHSSELGCPAHVLRTQSELLESANQMAASCHALSTFVFLRRARVVRTCS